VILSRVNRFHVHFFLLLKRLTDGKYVHSRINQHLSWKHGSLYIPKGNKRTFCFIDDLHLAKVINFFLLRFSKNYSFLFQA
jgi:hypothetical protein